MTLQFAEFAVSARLTSQMVDAIRWAILDCFAVILAGTSSEVVARVADGLVVDGQGIVPVYGINWQTSPSLEALINAAVDTHPTVVLLPALLAVSNNRPVFGQQLLTAYAVGFELIARLGESVTLDHYNRGALHCNH